MAAPVKGALKAVMGIVKYLASTSTMCLFQPWWDGNASHLAIPNGGFLFIGGAPGRYLGLYLQLLGSIIETRRAICKILSWSDVVPYK
jgi:hypothetical protein